MAWRLALTRRAERDMDKIRLDDRGLLLAALERVAADPGSEDIAKLAGREGQWRLRSGRWRAILELDTRAGTITVVRVLPRNEATYRG